MTIPNFSYIDPTRNTPEFFSPLSLLPQIREFWKYPSQYSTLIIQPELDKFYQSDHIEDIPKIPCPKPDIIIFPLASWDNSSTIIREQIFDFSNRGHRVFFIYPDNFLVEEQSPRFCIRIIQQDFYEVVLANKKENCHHQNEKLIFFNSDISLSSLCELRQFFGINECFMYVYEPEWGKLATLAKLKWDWQIILDTRETDKNFDIDQVKQELREYSNFLIVTHKRYDTKLINNNAVYLEELHDDYQVKDFNDVILNYFRETRTKVSIIILTCNNYPYTKLCLDSIIRNTEYPNYEIIIVDNLSEDETRASLPKWKAAYPHIKFILNDKNLGFSKGNNQGLELAKGEILILLNNDTIVPPGWLSRLSRHLHDPNVGIIGPVSNSVGNSAKIEVDYSTYEQMISFSQERCREFDNQVSPINMLGMFCVALRRDIYKNIGPLDELFGIGTFEDDDYCLRIRNEGYAIFCALDVFVHHFGSVSFNNLDNKPNIFNENKILFERKWNKKKLYHRSEILYPYYHFEVDFTNTSEELIKLYENRTLIHLEHINLINGFLAERDEQLVKCQQLIQQLNHTLAEREQSIQQLNHTLAEREQSIQQLNHTLAEREQEVMFYATSKSWKVTRPLRKGVKFLKRVFNKNG